MSYATPTDVQEYLPAAVVTINATGKPTTATVTAWLVEISAWMDAALSWRYTVPVTNADDVTLLLPVAALLAAARCLRFEAIRQGSETRERNADAYDAQAYALFVYAPQGLGSTQPGGSSVFSAQSQRGIIGRSLLILPNTGEVSATAESDEHYPDGSFDVEPGEGEEPDRAYSLDMTL